MEHYTEESSERNSGSPLFCCLGRDSEQPLCEQKNEISACSSSASFSSAAPLLNKKRNYLGRKAKMDEGSRREMNILINTTLEPTTISQDKKFATVEEPVQPAKHSSSLIPQVFAALAVSLASMVIGFSSAYTSPALVSMNEPDSTLPVSPQEESWIGSLLPLLALVGGCAGGPMIEIIGRKWTILITSVPFIASFVLISLATSVAMVMVGRALAGFSVGVTSLALPIYLGETLQPEVRGALGLLPTVIGNGGILVCFVAGKYLDWSELAMLGACLPIAFITMMFFIPETPRFYINKNQYEKAKKALKQLRGSNADITQELTEIEKTIKTSKEESPNISELFSRKYVWPLLISIGLMFFQQMSGINAVIFYTVKIFQDAGSTIDSNFSAIIVGLVNVGSTFIASVLIERLGRKILLYISSISMVITLITLGMYFYLKDSGADVTAYGWLPLASFVIFVIGFSIGFGPIPWLMMGEILPARIRGVAASVVTAFNWTCTFIVTKTFADLIGLLGSHGTFWVFGGFCLVGLVFVVTLVPETQGKSLEDIEKCFASSNPNKVPNSTRSTVNKLKPEFNA